MITRLAAVLALALPAVAEAAAPPLVPITGYLTDDAGVPIDDTVTLHFKLYAAATGPTFLWDESQDVDVVDGQFTAYLGDQETLDLAFFKTNGTVFLGIAIDAGNEMSPRLEVATAPFAAYAQHADDAARLGSIDAADYRLTADPVDWALLTNVPAALQDGDADTTYTAGTGLLLSTGNAFSVDVPSVEAWARNVCYDAPSELRGQLDTVYAARMNCTADQVLISDASGTWSCIDVAALPLSEAAIDALVADNGYAAASDVAALTTRVGTAEGAITTLSTNLGTTNGNVTTVTNAVAALATPGTLNTSSNPVDWTKLKGVPSVIRNVGMATQNANVTALGATWTDIPGATLTVSVPAGGSTLRLRANGSVTGSGGGATYTHCGFRFVIGTTGYGQVTWGDTILGVARSGVGHPGWWAPWTISRDVPLAAGSHTVKVQMTGWSGSDVACYADLNEYSATRLVIEAY